MGAETGGPNCRINMPKQEVLCASQLRYAGQVVELTGALRYKMDVGVLDHVLHSVLAAIRIIASKTRASAFNRKLCNELRYI